MKTIKFLSEHILLKFHKLTQWTVCLFIFGILASFSINAQPNTWLGTTSSDWMTPSNWDQMHVPLPTEDVVINPPTVPSVSEPIINTAAVAQSVLINGGATLTGNSGSLTVSNSTGIGIEVLGTLVNNSNCIIEVNNTASDGISMTSATSSLNNSGLIRIGTSGGASNIGRDGIRCDGTFSHSATGSILIRNITEVGINQLGSTASIDAPVQLFDIDSTGIRLAGTININANATIGINNTGDNGIYIATGATLSNGGSIDIGSLGAAMNIGFNGIESDGTFITTGSTIINNSTNVGLRKLANSMTTNSGLIQIDNTGGNGLVSLGTLTNNNEIKIGTVGAASNISVRGIFSSGVINNNSGATIFIDNVGTVGIRKLSSGIINNGGDIRIGTLGAAFNIVGAGIISDGTFTNLLGSQVIINNTTSNNLNVTFASSFTNDGFVGLDNSLQTGLFNDGAFNNSSGLISIDNSITNGIDNTTNGTFINGGEIIIGSNGLISDVAFDNLGTFTNNADGYVQLDAVQKGIRNRGSLSNDGEIIVGNGSSFNSFGIENINTASFNNNVCATIELYDDLSNTSTTTLVNDGYFLFNTPGPHTIGFFDNNGVIDDPQIGFDVDAVNFSNNNIVITPTTIDACQAAAVMPAFDIISSMNYSVQGIYDDSAAANSAGMYDSNTNTFTPSTSLLPGSSYVYYVKLISSINSMNCEVVVEWNVTVGDDTITFTGMGNDMDWHNPLNWDLQIVPDVCHHVIIPGANIVEIYSGLVGLGKTLDVRLDACLETKPGGEMDIQN